MCVCVNLILLLLFLVFGTNKQIIIIINNFENMYSHIMRRSIWYVCADVFVILMFIYIYFIIDIILYVLKFYIYIFYVVAIGLYIAKNYNVNYIYFSIYLICVPGDGFCFRENKLNLFIIYIII